MKKYIAKKNFIQNKILRNFASQIPVIDLKNFKYEGLKEWQDVGKQIDEANKEIGFFLIKNTGIDFDHVTKTIKTCEEFFLSHMENKMKCRIDNPPENKAWGYFHRNLEQLQRGKDFQLKEKKSYLNDINESYNIQNDNPKANLPKRIFPQYPKEFEPVFSKYWRDCEILSANLLRGFAYGLNIDPSFFEEKFEYSASSLRVLHYPENVKLQPGQFRASEHTDYGSLTILYSTEPGLQVKNRKGEWKDIEVPLKHFIVNIGDLMAFWTNDRWISTPHRVVSNLLNSSIFS